MLTVGGGGRNGGGGRWVGGAPGGKNGGGLLKLLSTSVADLSERTCMLLFSFARRLPSTRLIVIV